VSGQLVRSFPFAVRPGRHYSPGRRL
jgi:hypothetical protein